MANWVRSVIDAFRRPRQLAADGAPPVALTVGDRAALAKLNRRALDSIQNFVAGIGTTAYDKSAYNQWGVVFAITQMQANAMYRGDWLCARIINSVADDMTRAWITCTWDGYEKDKRAKDLETAEQNFGVRQKVNEAIKWSRLYGGSGIVISIKGEDLSTPLVIERVKKGTLQLLQVRDRWRLYTDGILDSDPNSQNYDRPEYYYTTETNKRVHWSRVLIFDGRVLPDHEWRNNGYWHDSELQALQTNIEGYAATRAAVASMVWESNVDVVKTPDLAVSLSTADGTAAAAERFRSAMQTKSMNRMLVLDKEEEYQQKQVTFSGVNEVLEKFMVDVCGAAEIPMPRLFGRSASGLNATGESDIRNYYDHIANRQGAGMRTQLWRLYQVLVRSTFGTMPDGFDFRFNPLWQVSDKERADIGKVQAETDEINFNIGAMTPGMIARELKDRGTYRTMEDEDVAMVQETAEAQAERDDEIDMARAKALAMPAKKKPGPGGEAETGPAGAGAVE